MRRRGRVCAKRCIDAHGQVLCAFLLEQSEPRGIGTPLSILATEPTTKLVAAGQCSVNGVDSAWNCTTLPFKLPSLIMNRRNIDEYISREI